MKNLKILQKLKIKYFVVLFSLAKFINLFIRCLFQLFNLIHLLLMKMKKMLYWMIMQILMKMLYLQKWMLMILMMKMIMKSESIRMHQLENKSIDYQKMKEIMMFEQMMLYIGEESAQIIIRIKIQHEIQQTSYLHCLISVILLMEKWEFIVNLMIVVRFDLFIKFIIIIRFVAILIYFLISVN